jgi:hypothetical protein
MGTFYSGDAIIIAKTEDALKDGVELIVASPMARWYEDVPGMAKIKEFSAIHHPEMKEWPPAYIEGWIMAMLYTEVLNKCGDIITREKFRDILESIKDFDPGKLMPSVSYGPDKHKGTTKVKIYKANARAKRFEALTDWVE